MSLPQAIDGMDKLKLCCLLIFGLVICLKEVGGAKTCEIDSVLCYSDLSEPNDPPVFHDLTRKEMKSVQTYLYHQPDLRLLLPDQAQINNSFIQGMELYLPNKKDVLQYLNANAPTPQPPRAAVVTIFRGDCDPAKVEEYIVFPLPWPTQHRLHRTIPYYLRPFNDKEFASISDFLNKEVDGTLGHFLQESFGGRLLNCGKRCLGFQLASPVGPSVSNEPGARKSWYWLHQVVEYSILHPVDFSVLMKIVGCVYYIEKVYFNNMYFNSLQELALHYRNPSFPRLKIPYPIESKQLFSKMERRGVLFPEKPVSPPRQVEPEGKRYSVKYQEVKYMNWKFNFRLSPGLGPRLHNIRYLDRMIVYELALQDIVVFYSGAEPPHQYANFFDSSYLIGMNLQGMVPGVDCPTGATFIDSYVMTESSIKPAKLINAFCVFEQNTGDFLRRHISKAAPDGPFYEGSPSIVLVFRAITTIANYDYTIDFIFHQNGVLQTKVVPTGYILPRCTPKRMKTNTASGSTIN
nr:copper amine oxidase [Pinctada fucata]